jgi:hypothetical protein
MTGNKSLDDLYCEFNTVMDQLLHHLALERGHDLSHGMAPNLRDELQEEGAALYERWCEEIESKMEPAVDSAVIRDLLTQLYRIDDQIDYEIERGGGSEGKLQ